MKIATFENTTADFVAWYKYHVSFEEKLIWILIFSIIVGAVVCMFGTMSNNLLLLFGSVLFVIVVAVLWCIYTRLRFDKELRVFSATQGGITGTISFSRHGIKIEQNNESFYYSFDQIIKAREIPWFLFLFVNDKQYPIIIDKRKIQTVNNNHEPYYIAKVLREQSPDYKYSKNSDLTYVGKYRKLLPFD